MYVVRDTGWSIGGRLSVSVSSLFHFNSLVKGNESPVNLLIYQVSPELSTKKDTGNRAATHFSGNARIQQHSSVHFNFFYTWHPGPSQ